MVGLFWITPDAAYVGSPPAADGSCVRLTAHGLEAVDPNASRSWAWEGLHSAALVQTPARPRPAEGPARSACHCRGRAQPPAATD